MPLTTAQRLERLRVRTTEISFWRDRATRPVDGWTLDGSPITMGAPWPERTGTHHFEATAEVPDGWPLGEVRLRLNLGGESLVTLSGDGTTRSYGLDPYHQEFPLPARSTTIRSDTVARLPFGQPVREPKLTTAQVVWIDGVAHAFHLLLTQVAEAAETLEEHDVVPHLLTAAEEALYALDWPTDGADVVARTSVARLQQRIWELPELKVDPAPLTDAQRDSVKAAHTRLTGALRDLATRFPPQGEITLTGHAHIDLAWLWPYDETRRKMRRTFHTALGLMEASKDFRFNQSTAHYYWQMEQDDPDLLERIKPAVASGQWETIGGMWVEPDTNMPTGESLVRQVLYGQRYFERVFGKRHTVCWLPDCFGFSPALPQLLKQGGIDNFFTIKVNWSETNRFPHDLFWWEGLAGDRVLAHTFDNPMQGYNGFVRPDCHMPTWRNFRGKSRHGETLLAVGYGDGGGGVTPEMVEREVQLRDFPVLPRAKWGHVADFYDRARDGEPETGYPVWEGEIYLEFHRATLTTQSHVKRLHRHAERALITAEVLGSLGALLGGDLPQSLEQTWVPVLKNEFHDILPGSGIREINADAEKELAAALEIGLNAQRAAVADIAGRMPKGDIADALVVVNPCDSPRPLTVTLPDGGHASTNEVVPALGALVVDSAKLAAKPGLSASKKSLENAHLKATIGKDGTVTSLIHKDTGREALDGPGNQLWVYANERPRQYEAWDIEEDYARTGSQLVKPDSIELVEHGPHRAAIRVVHSYRASTITQTYALTANGTRVDIETEIDWHDRRTLLRSLTPMAIRVRQATFECAHGVVQRPTHDNTSWDEAQFEVPAHRFADLSEPDFGVALLNDAKYGHSAKGNVLGLSLVRGPIYPDPYADEGHQRFTYALYPHAGGWAEGGVRQQAEALNQPLLTAAASGLAAHSVSLVALTGVEAAVSGLKPSEDGSGLVLRVYEPAGRRGALSVGLPEGWSLGEAVNLLEEPAERAEGPDLLPFELRSWKVGKG